MEREYSKRRNAEIEHELGRSASAVRNRAQYLGLKKPPEFFENGRKQKEAAALKADIRVNRLGKNERIPPMPCCLLWHLKEMEGCMDTTIVLPNKTQREYHDRLKAAKPLIKEMLQKQMSGTEIAKAMDMRYSTVYGYIKEIQAAA